MFNYNQKITDRYIGNMCKIKFVKTVLKFREYVSKGQSDNLNHKHESYSGELTEIYKQHFPNFKIIYDYITDNYNILFVVKKLSV